MNVTNTMQLAEGAAAENQSDAQLQQMSADGLLELLRLSLQEENEKINDVHQTVIDARESYKDQPGGHLFALIDRVLEPAGDHYLIEAIVHELRNRLTNAATPGHLQ
jgi:hypothetical protein